MEGFSQNGRILLGLHPKRRVLTPVSELPQAIPHLFKRDCLSCPPDSPSCPSCPAGQVCSLIPQSCNQCAHTVCVSSGVTGGGPPKSAGPNVGAIAGGVVGGIAFIAVLTFAIWWFWIRPKRNAWYEEDWDDQDEDATAAKTQFKEQRNDRRSVHSVASTVLSRASNMIPIAFIPGVTNRDTNSPPVPPIPAARKYAPSPLSSQHNGDAIFFSPGDLRNSAYSDSSSLRNRDTHYGRPSITASLARESVVSEVFHDNAQEHPMPALQAMRIRPNMVSVKTSASGSKGPSPLATGRATPVTLDEGEFFVSAPSTHSTPSLHSKGSFVKPTTVTIPKKSAAGRFPVRTASDDSVPQAGPSTTAHNYADTTDDETDEAHAPAHQSLLSSGDSATSSDDTPGASQSPFIDTAGHSHGRLSKEIIEATRRASRMPLHSGLGGRSEGPFGDEHASGED